MSSAGWRTATSCPSTQARRSHGTIGSSTVPLQSAAPAFSSSIPRLMLGRGPGWAAMRAVRPSTCATRSVPSTWRMRRTMKLPSTLPGPGGVDLRQVDVDLLRRREVRRGLVEHRLPAAVLVVELVVGVDDERAVVARAAEQLRVDARLVGDALRGQPRRIHVGDVEVRGARGELLEHGLVLVVRRRQRDDRRPDDRTCRRCRSATSVSGSTCVTLGRGGAARRVVPGPRVDDLAGGADADLGRHRRRCRSRRTPSGRKNERLPVSMRLTSLAGGERLRGRAALGVEAAVRRGVDELVVVGDRRRGRRGSGRS